MRIAIDAMGGDRSARGDHRRCLRARWISSGSRSCWSGEDPCGPSCPTAGHRRAWSSSPARRSSRWTDARGVGAHEEGRLARAARRARCATGRPDAMVGAGNTGATMAAALLRMRTHPRRRPSRDRLPDPGPGHERRMLLVDGGATPTARPSGWCSSRLMARDVRPASRLGVDEPTVGLLSNGEESGKGDDAAQGDPARCSAVKPWLRRQRRGPRPDAPRRPT